MQPQILLQKLHRLNFNQNLIDLVGDFLTNRRQCVRFNNFLSDNLSITVGAPQGTKLGPILWLLYSNDLTFPDFNIIKYADDTTFYKLFNTKAIDQADTVTSAIVHTKDWSELNGMLLNTSKTVIMNINFNTRLNITDQLLVGTDILSPVFESQFLGVTIDNKLSFSSHVSKVLSKCNAKIFIMLQLKRLGMSIPSLKNFYCAFVRSNLVYGAPAWFFMLSTHDQTRLESIQRSATRIILPTICYQERLEFLNLPSLKDFIYCISRNHFSKILNDSSHPLFKHLCFNTNNRTSSRKSRIFKLPKFRTTKHQRTFLNTFMKDFNET